MLPICGSSTNSSVPVVQTGDAGATTSLPLQIPELCLEFCSRADIRYQDIRNRHYVKNKGVHAQQIHFLIWFRQHVVGIISGSSCVYATPARDKFFGITRDNREKVLRGIINNIVFRLEYAEPNLATRVLSLWRKIAPAVWEYIYEAKVFGFETLVIPDRTKIKEGGQGSEPEDEPVRQGDFKNTNGVLYKADNWTFAGMTEGNTKNHDDAGLNESYKIKKVQPKAVWCIWVPGFDSPVESHTTSTWQAGKKWSETLERRLSRTIPDITEEKWLALSKDLKKKAAGLTMRRQAYLGKKLYLRGRYVQTI